MKLKRPKSTVTAADDLLNTFKDMREFVSEKGSINLTIRLLKCLNAVQMATLFHMGICV